MKLGNKKGHISGRKVAGTHTSVIDGADRLLKKISTKEWFISARPREIIIDRGGTPSITIKRHSNTAYQNTLTLTFRKTGSVQKVDIVVANLTENIAGITEDIKTIAAKNMRGAEIYDRTNMF